MSDQPAVEPTPEPKPVSAKAVSLTPEKAKPKSSFLGPESKAGRAMRKTIRVLGFIVGFFGLGFFTAYLLLYRPLQRQARSSDAQLTQLRQDIQTKQAELDKAGLTFLGVQAQNKQLTADLEKAQAQSVALGALTQVSEARVRLAEKNISAARLALDQAEKQLSTSLPTLEALGAARPTTLTQLFELARSDLSRDSNLAAQDLERLSSELMLISETLSR
jgi:septal ring factor EnvC (AmiA/AmiB activator)